MRESSNGGGVRAFGWALVWLAALEVITGVALMSPYRADAGAAYQSMAAIRASALWRTVHAFHHWLSALLIILIAIYVVVLLFNGGYRFVAKLAWPFWPILFGIVMLFQLTGHLLPWDTHAIGTATVESGIAAGIPLVGPPQANLIRGGDVVGPETLRRWYLAHIIILPVALLVCVVAVFAYWRGMGIGKLKPNWTLVLGAIAASLFLALTLKPPYYGAPGPDDFAGATAKPEWYILPMHAMLVRMQHFSPRLGFIGTAVVPGLAFLFLLALPWLDKQKGVGGTWWVRTLTVLALVGAIALVFPLVTKRRGAGTYYASLWGAVSTQGATVTGVDPPFDPKQAQLGKRLYADLGCSDCHRMGGVGETEGPALDVVGRRRPSIAWHIAHLRNPDSIKPGSTMPSVEELSKTARHGRKITDAEIGAIAQYLSSLK